MSQDRMRKIAREHSEFFHQLQHLTYEQMVSITKKLARQRNRGEISEEEAYIKAKLYIDYHFSGSDADYFYRLLAETV